jgi:hypothetical protein
LAIENWQEFDGHKLSGRFPSKYKLGGMITMNKQILDGYQRFLGGHQAVYYSLGSAVMMGMIDDKPNFLGSDPYNYDNYAVGMGIGKKPLYAAIGLWTPDNQAKIPQHGIGKSHVGPVRYWPDLVPFL